MVDGVAREGGEVDAGVWVVGGDGEVGRRGVGAEAGGVDEVRRGGSGCVERVEDVEVFGAEARPASWDGGGGMVRHGYGFFVGVYAG